MKKTYLLPLALLFLAFSCSNPKTAENKPNVLDSTAQKVDNEVVREKFQKDIDGKKVDLYTLKNQKGMEVKITNYGCRIVSLKTPDRKGKFDDVVLGFKTIDEYVNDKNYLGCIVGRFANRIGKAEFKLENKTYQLAKNNNGNTLHGGEKGLHHRVWDATQNGDTLTLTYTSPDMEEGYPGEMKITLKYSLNNDNELKMEYFATTNKTTVINVSNHAYYNLLGEGEGDILGHQMQILADQTTPVDSLLIPTGKLASVDKTPFDFRQPVEIGKRINEANEQLKYGKGYDHNWILNKKGNELALALRIIEPKTGRILEVSTTEPAMQFYSGNFMDGKSAGKKGKAYNYRSAIVFEPQHYPDSPNHANFPSTVLKAGQTYHQLSVYKFSAK